MVFFHNVMGDHSAQLPKIQQFDNCMQCPFLYRISESCPKYPDLYTPIPPDMFTEDDLVFPMNELVGYMNYRMSILMELKTNELVLMNLQLYLAWIFEIVMVITSLLTWMVPLGSFILFAFKRRPAMCRVCIVVLLLKFMTAFSIYQFEFGYSPGYRCATDGQLYKNRNLDEPIVIMSGFFTYLALNSPNTSYRSPTNQYDIFDSRHFIMISVGTFFFLSYCSKLHMQQGNEVYIITSFEIGMMFTIIIKVVMNIFSMWPSTFHSYIEPSLNEEILLTHLCAKWRIDNNLPK